ncbi:MAG: amidohydrolase family protein [Syntrophobacteraceae bacterium]
MSKKRSGKRESGSGMRDGGFIPAPFSAPPVIHRAEWIVPVCSPPVRNGAVLIHGGRIAAAGPFPAVRRDSPAGARLADHGQAALFPALVNAHTHLELSALRGRIPFPQPGFREWIGLLFPLRAAMGPHGADEGLRAGYAELFTSGTGLCGDITNGGAILRPSTFSKIPERQVFFELLGFNLNSVGAAMHASPAGGRAVEIEARTFDPAPQVGDACPALVPHSVYSVSPAIIAESKEWTRARGLPFSIHAAEHIEEIEFLRSGKGFCRELLEMLGRWDPGWKPPGKTPLEYLDGLGALDYRTLLVHAVHMTESDWALAAQKNCNVVFCARSNWNLGSGSPRIEKALSLGINCALGTDSLAGNTDLNLFAEAGFTLDNYPSVNPEKVIEMITLNPARALGRKGDFGSLEPGAKAHLLAVTIQSGVDESNLAESLIQSGKEGACKWVDDSQS